MSFLSHEDLRKLHITDEDIRTASTESYRNRNRVFLSHSSKDDEHIPFVIKFLIDFGVSVYTDNGDKRLPQIPSPETASILRNEIKNSDRFIVLVSKNSSTSGWIPWELGMADGHKGYSHIALLPITSTGDEENWARREYLGLYPVIRKSGVVNRDGLHWIVDPPTNDKATYLSDWLTN